MQGSRRKDRFTKLLQKRKAAEVTQRQHLIDVLSRRAAAFQTNIVHCCVAQNIESL
jgi:hypothetical protein